MHRPLHRLMPRRTPHHHPGGKRGPLVAAVALVLVATGLAGSAALAHVLEGDRVASPRQVLTSDSAKERGTQFSPRKRSSLRALRFFRAEGDQLAHRARVWNSAGKQLAEVQLPASTEVGWQRVDLPAPVTVRRTRSYVVSVSVPRDTPIAVKRPTPQSGRNWTSTAGARGTVGRYPARELKRTHFLVRPVLAADGGTSTTTTTTKTTPAPTPTPTPTPAPGGAFPNAANTGVPDGVALAPYSGPTTIRTPGTVIDGKQVNGSLVISATGVTINRSLVKGMILVDLTGSLTITDSTVDGGAEGDATVNHANITMRRVEVIGGRASVACNFNCDIQDSWLHGQYIEPGSDWHGDGFLSNGGSKMVLRHNTLACDSKPTGSGGACSAAVALYGDFEPIQDVIVDNNLFVPSPASYCMYGGYGPGKPYGTDVRNVVISNNVFARGTNRKCAAFGAITSVAPSGSNGNVFSGNSWDDGQAIR
jgi:Domain of unknown function (DUF4082)